MSGRHFRIVTCLEKKMRNRLERIQGAFDLFFFFGKNDLKQYGNGKNLLNLGWDRWIFVTLLSVFFHKSEIFHNRRQKRNGIQNIIKPKILLPI